MVFSSPVVRQLVLSLRTQPERWRNDGRVMSRDDGVIIAFGRRSNGQYSRPRLKRPREVELGLLEGYAISRAIRRWQHRPLEAG